MSQRTDCGEAMIKRITDDGKNNRQRDSSIGLVQEDSHHWNNFGSLEDGQNFHYFP